ncbi:MAG: class I tRNA ligase family protein, partial [Bacteroidaceae bacterium]|nr:class I tRNA ligase family protein [Bacteroidaceae bacterium]
DPTNDKALLSEQAAEYWQNVDLYVGGSEHATGHLIYARFWNHFLFDLGVSKKAEPFQKLINQGMIQGRSNFEYRIKDTNTFVSFGLKDKYDTTQIHVDVNIVKNDVLDLEAFKAWRPEFNTAEFILEDEKYICGWAVEKMSKSMFNVVNPDMIVERYGADTLRLYEMFLGPLEQSKPWDTNGIDGCHRFLKKLWQLFWDKDGNLQVEDAEPSADNMKTLHKLIKKVSADIEEFSFNTSISAFMVATNELTAQKCHNREVLKQMVTLLAPFAPHMAEELWEAIVGEGSVCDAQWPAFDEKYLVEASVQLGVQFNGKVRFSMQFPSEATPEEMIQMATSAPEAQKYLEGKQIVKAIAIPKRIVNIVIK